MFGPSLGVADKEVLVPDLTLSYSMTTVYYHDQDSFDNLVANLTAPLGMDEVISYTGDSDAPIRFVEQRKGPEANRGTQRQPVASA